MPGGDDTAIAEEKNRIDLVDYVRIGNGVDLIHPDDLAVPSEADLVSAANDIQVTDTYVILDRQFLNARDDVEMAHRYVVVNIAFAGVDNAEPDANSFADLVAEAQAIEGAFQERRKNRAYRQHQQTRLARFVHLDGQDLHDFLRMYRIYLFILKNLCESLSNQLPAFKLCGGTLDLVLRCLLTNPREQFRYSTFKSDLRFVTE